MDPFKTMIPVCTSIHFAMLLNWKWAGGVLPNLTSTVNKTDIVTVIYDGTTFYGTIVKNF